jgi:hypothetical protein
MFYLLGFGVTLLRPLPAVVDRDVRTVDGRFSGARRSDRGGGMSGGLSMEISRE